MILLRKTLQLLLGLMILVSSVRAQNLTPLEADRRAAQYLRQFQVIRMGMTEAPGFGHQAYTVMVMKRLRELGFEGKIEIYYDPKVKSKLQYLLPGFKSEGATVQVLGNSQDVTLIEWEKRPGEFVDTHRRGQVALGIMGADDLLITPQELGVDTLIRIQPSEWRGPPTVQSKEGQRAQFVELSDHPTKLKPPVISNPAEFLQQQMSTSPSLKAKVPGLEALLENRSRLEILSAYGLGFKKGPDKLANLIHAIEQARALKPERFKGPVVIPLLSSFNEQEWAAFQAKLLSNKTSSSLLKIQNTADAGVSSTIQKLQKNEILLMPVGAVPQDVWNAIMDASTLPPTVAGASGISFAKSRGRPFMNTADASDILPAKVPVYSPMMAAHRGLIDAKNQEQLRNYILDSLDRDSPLSKAFMEQAQILDSQPDKVSAVLSKSGQYLMEAKATQAPPVGGNCLRKPYGDLVPRNF